MAGNKKSSKGSKRGPDSSKGESSSSNKSMKPIKGFLPTAQHSHNTIMEWTKNLAQRVGDGVTSSVYKGFDTDNDVPIVVKVFHSTEADRACYETERGFYQNKALGHRYLVRSFGFGITNQNQNFIVLEWLKSSLDVVANEMVWPQTIIVLYQIASALKFLHDKDYVHMDIKMGNILVNEVINEAKICDFGFTSREGVMIRGYTPSCASEEIKAKREVVASKAMDVYSLGMVIKSLVFEGDVTMKGKTNTGTVKKLLRTSGCKPNPTGHILADLVCNCLAGEPTDRPTMKYVVTTLKDIYDESV